MKSFDSNCSLKHALNVFLPLNVVIIYEHRHDKLYLEGLKIAVDLDISSVSAISISNNFFISKKCLKLMENRMRTRHTFTQCM